jgi:hypothetical protein
MQCFECARKREVTPALSVCRHCGAGLCLEHTYEAAEYRVGGTVFGCPHDLRRSPDSRPLRTASGRG